MQAGNTELLENFAARLKAAMSRRGVTLQQVATHCGVAVSTVGAWTQAQNWPKMEVQPRLADFLGLPLMHLVHGVPPEPEYGRSEFPENPEEPYLAHATPRQIRAEVRKQIETTLAAAGEDSIRLGWIAEQVRAHVTAPPHWKKGPVMVPIYDPAQDQALSSETGQPIQRPARPAQSA